LSIENNGLDLSSDIKVTSVRDNEWHLKDNNTYFLISIPTRFLIISNWNFLDCDF
jgi:hypothetical protein